MATPTAQPDDASDLCRCECHTGRSVHPVPCSCQPCLFCMRPIRPERMTQHLEICKKIRMPAAP